MHCRLRLLSLRRWPKSSGQRGEPDEELEDSIEQYRKINEEDIAPTEAEKSLFAIFDEAIESQVLEEEDGMSRYEDMIMGAKIQVMADIINSLEAEAKDRWDKLMDTDPNMMQFGFTLDAMAQILHKKTYDQLYEAKLTEIVSEVRKYESETDELASQITKLNDDQLSQVQKMLEMGYGQKANNLMQAFINE